eukprot:g33640.t1
MVNFVFWLTGLIHTAAIVHHADQTTELRDHWTADAVPNPMKSPEQCGLSAPGHLCDPDLLLSENERRDIEQVLLNITRQTGVMCPDGRLALDETAFFARTGEAFAHHVGDAWGVGHAGCDNGVMLFLSISDRMFYLKTAKKTREVLTDGLAQRILDNMKPLLKGGYVADAILKGSSEILLALQGSTVPVYRSWGDYFTIFILSIVFCCHLPQILAFFLVAIAAVFGLLLYPFAKLADVFSGWWRNWHTSQAQQDLERVQLELDKDEFDQAMCPICLEDFNFDGGKSGDMQKLECKHCFHGACIAEWLRDHESCPLCRAEVDVQLTEADQKKPEHYQRRLRFYLSRLSSRYPSTFRSSRTPFYTSSNDHYFPGWVRTSKVHSPGWTDSLSGHFHSITTASSHMASVGPGGGGGGGGFGGGGFGGGGGAGGGW